MTGEELAAVIAAVRSLQAAPEEQNVAVSAWKRAARLEAVEIE